MKINPAKWLRRQVLDGKPITAGNVLDLTAELSGYRGIRELALALIAQEITPKMALKGMEDGTRRALLKALQDEAVRVQGLIAKVQESRPAGKR